MVSLLLPKTRTLFFDFLPLDLGSVNDSRPDSISTPSPDKSSLQLEPKLIHCAAWMIAIASLPDSAPNRARANAEACESAGKPHGYNAFTVIDVHDHP